MGRGPKTLLNWHALFETAEELIQNVKMFKGNERMKQTVENLNRYLTDQIKNNKSCGFCPY
jgi:hypothetical protein